MVPTAMASLAHHLHGEVGILVGCLVVWIFRPMVEALDSGADGGSADRKGKHIPEIMYLAL